MYRDGGSYRELPVAPASLREQVLMHTRQAFKRRGNMSYDDSRAGNATNACAQCLKRVRGDMRIVCLITVGAFLLSIAIAESDVPIGASQYQQRPRLILEPVNKMQSNGESNPINWLINMVQRVIEPKNSHSPMIGPINLPGLGGHIYIRQKEKTVMPWEASNRVVIKLVSRDPVTGNVMPIDSLPFHHRPEEPAPYHHRPEAHPSPYHRPEDHSSYHHRPEDHSSYHHRPEDPSRRATKTYGYPPVNHAPLRPINNIQKNSFVPVSPQPHYSSWHAQQRPHYQQHYVPQYSKPFRASSPNDFRYENYGKEADQGYGKGYHEDYAHRRPNRMSYHHRFTPGVAQPMNAVPLHSMYRSVAHQPSNPDPVYSSNEYNDRLKDSKDTEDQGEDYYAEKPDSLRGTQLPYPEYPGLPNEELQTITTTKADNVSHVEHTSASPFRSSYREVIRADRMVPASSHRNHLRSSSRGRKTKTHPRGSYRNGKSRGFRDGTRFDAKFEARDVGGIEVITAPNLQRGWEDYDPEKSRQNDNHGSRSREADSGLNLDEDSISMGNGKNLARGESVEHSNERTDSHDEENFVPVSRKAHSRRSSYKVIDRSHRSQRRNNSTDDDDDESQEISAEIIVGTKEHSTEVEIPDSAASVASTEAEENVTINNVTSASGEKVVTVTPSNYRRIQTRRKPRVVKAIYRRKPVAGIIRSSAESVESSESVEEKSSQESSSSEN